MEESKRNLPSGTHKALKGDQILHFWLDSEKNEGIENLRIKLIELILASPYEIEYAHQITMTMDFL